MEDDIAKKASETVDRLEKEVISSLKHKEPAYPRLEQQLARLRTACQDYVFADFELAAKHKIESRLWEAHSKVNKTFRVILARFREGESKKKHVERRKAEKLYLDFIKSSMRFYRGYIQRLASHFADIPEVFEVARKFNLDITSADSSQLVDLALKKQIIRSCYLTLIQLGDLSRYRETELQTKERNWGPAKGYYDLATTLDPSSGMSYNQLAVIALADQDHLRAVYYLYRAISAPNAAPQAEGNLKIEFRKVKSKLTQGKPLSDVATIGDGNTDLLHRFLLFHARCFEAGFTGHEDQQSEILDLLANELRARPCDTLLRKFCLINIAAEKYAADKIMEAGRDSDIPVATSSYKMLQHHNILTFTRLLKMLLEELQRLGSVRADSVTFLCRRLLPHLRIYSGWLLSNVDLLPSNNFAQTDLREFWQVYALTVTLLIQKFAVPTIGDIAYLLEEDQDTLGFTPFQKSICEERFYDFANSIKPMYSESMFGERSIEKEMLYRMKGLVKDGLMLCQRTGHLEPESNAPNAAPLLFAGKQLIYTGQTDLQTSSSLGSSIHMNSSAGSVNVENIDRVKSSLNAISQRRSNPDDITETSMKSTMENMVFALTEREEPISSMKTPSAHGLLRRRSQLAHGPEDMSDNAHSFRRSTGSVSGLQGHMGGHPIIPPVTHSPFTPTAEESGFSPGAGPARRPDPLPFPVQLSSSVQFNAQIKHMQQQIEMRSSPLESLQPTLSSHYDSPTHLTSRNHQHKTATPPLSPWQDLSQVLGRTLPTRSPEPSPFGAIGEARPKSSRAPTSGQPG
ncbi:uncharacterized protein PV06_09544 [Exophiala oligosperma]|uniref:DNA/RNA-binding domain-containing protein n=1 Tax=Exophiala oligosperma TaxID=215243 RepID=A0A0D2D5Z2_9EURO|nr:uncharacterized protein PV06_09544 [Exophiala oligosperma]KIW38588.1 hypothetical protein PV06_09544 [Exophiala oligosperma]